MTTPAAPAERQFRNAVRRPVELHLATGTTVLLPGEVITLPADDAYCAALVRRGVLTRHEPRPAAASPRTTTKAPTKKATTKKGDAAATASAKRAPTKESNPDTPATTRRRATEAPEPAGSSPAAETAVDTPPATAGEDT